MSEKFEGFSWRFDEDSNEEVSRKSPSLKRKARPNRVKKQTFKLRETVETLTSEQLSKSICISM